MTVYDSNGKLYDESLFREIFEGVLINKMYTLGNDGQLWLSLLDGLFSGMDYQEIVSLVENPIAFVETAFTYDAEVDSLYDQYGEKYFEQDTKEALKLWGPQDTIYDIYKVILFEQLERHVGVFEEAFEEAFADYEYEISQELEEEDEK